MKRRDFVSIGLASLGVASIPISKQAFAESHGGGIAPIGAAVADSNQGRIVSRIYPGRRQGTLIAMIRINGREVYRDITISNRIRQQLNRFLEEGEMPFVVSDESGSEVSFETSLNMDGSSISFSFRSNEFQGSGGATSGEDAPVAMSVLGAIVAIVAMLVGLAALAIATGTPLSASFRCGIACGLNLRVGAESMEPPGNGNFMHDANCDLLPPIGC